MDKMFNQYQKDINTYVNNNNTVNRTQTKFKLTMWFIDLLGFIICALLNIGVSRIGHGSIYTGDKDIVLPFSALLFLYYPLLIYLPEAHYKFLIYGDDSPTTLQKEQEQQQDMPWAFMITLLSITLAIIIHRLLLFNQQFFHNKQQTKQLKITQRSQPEKKVNNNRSHKNIQYRAQCKILKYYLSLAIGLQNIVSAFYITIQQSDSIIRNQFIIYAIFSLFINYGYGYVSGWSAVAYQLHYKLTYSINLGIFLGFVLGLIAPDNLVMLSLPCLCCGLMIYSCALVILPALFSNGQNQTQDKFRYGSIFTSLLMTVIYHPFCYLLRV